MLEKPLIQPSRPPFEPSITAKPQTRNPPVTRNTLSALRPNPGFRQFPSCGQLSRVDQFDAVSGYSGHRWDTRQFCAHVFNHFSAYCGSANRLIRTSHRTVWQDRPLSAPVATVQQNGAPAGGSPSELVWPSAGGWHLPQTHPPVSLSQNSE
jgi:hypothetical protein